MRAILAATVSVIAISTALVPAHAGNPACVPPGTTFDDEFQGSSVDWSKWSPSYWWAPNGTCMSNSGNCMSGGGLASFMVNPTYPPTSGIEANPYSVRSGTLTIGLFPTPASVNPSAVGNAPFLSGQLTTKNSFSQLYGYFEVKMQVPTGTGVSSAFWLLPADGSWPPEIDAPEIDADPHSILWGVHGPGNVTPTTNTYNAPDASAGMHTYAADWEPDTITFYLDGKQVAQAPTPSNMHTPMYLLLDTVANSGGWNGTPPNGYSGALQVQWVRAWPTKPSASTLASCGPAPSGPTVVASAPPSSSSAPSSGPAPGGNDQIGFDVAGNGGIDFVPAGATVGNMAPAVSASAPVAAPPVASSGTAAATLASASGGTDTAAAPDQTQSRRWRHWHYRHGATHVRHDQDGDGDDR